MNLDLIYTELIAEHSQYSPYKGTLEDATIKEKGHNPSCGDMIYLDVQIEEGLIKQARFHGVGCAISQASASMMIELLEGKSIQEAKVRIDTFIKMIKKEVSSDEALAILEDAQTLKNISTMPARVKCAVLAWHTLNEALDGVIKDQ